MFHCPNCMDTMDKRFQTSHKRICEWLTTIHKRDLESWLLAWMP